MGLHGDALAARVQAATACRVTAPEREKTAHAPRMPAHATPSIYSKQEDLDDDIDFDIVHCLSQVWGGGERPVQAVKAELKSRLFFEDARSSKACMARWAASSHSWLKR